MSVKRTQITIGIASFVFAGCVSIVLLLVFPDLQPDVVGLILWAAFYTLFWRIFLKTDHVHAATESAPLEKAAAHSGTVEDIQADPDERSAARKEFQKARDRAEQSARPPRKKRRRRVGKGVREIQHRARETAAAPMKPHPTKPRAGPISKRRQARGPGTILSGVLGAVGGLFGLWLPEILAYNAGADLVFSGAIYGACVECSSLGVLLGALVGILGVRFFKFSGFPAGLQSFLTGFLVSFLLWVLLFVLATT